MKYDNKRQLREIKRIVKRTGVRHARHTAKDLLRSNPDELGNELDYGRSRSLYMNNSDKPNSGID